MGLIGSLILGAVAGFIASKIMNEASGTLKNIILGVVGGFVGGFVFGLLDLNANGLIGRLLISVVGACICIWGGRKLF